MAEPERQQVVVSAVHITEAGLEAQFMVLPTSVREIAGKPISVVSIIQLPISHPAYGDEVKGIIKTIESMVADAMDAYDEAPPWAPFEPESDLDEDDDRPQGMGWS